jgi:hypothetical protein
VELKYKENPLWKVTGSIWLLVALLNLGLMIFMLSGITRGFGLLMSPLHGFVILSSTVLAVFYFKITSIDYVRLHDGILSIHRGLVFPRSNLNISEIEQGRIVGHKFILILKNEKEIEINLKQLRIKDFEKFKLKLEEHFT